jgi:hypothetical protein
MNQASSYRLFTVKQDSNEGYDGDHANNGNKKTCWAKPVPHKYKYEASQTRPDVFGNR